LAPNITPTTRVAFALPRMHPSPAHPCAPPAAPCRAPAVQLDAGAAAAMEDDLVLAVADVLRRSQELEVEEAGFQVKRKKVGRKAARSW
jgi:hypothetical protein